MARSKAMHAIIGLETARKRLMTNMMKRMQGKIGTADPEDAKPGPKTTPAPKVTPRQAAPKGRSLKASPEMGASRSKKSPMPVTPRTKARDLITGATKGNGVESPVKKKEVLASDNVKGVSRGMHPITRKLRTSHHNGSGKGPSLTPGK